MKIRLILLCCCFLFAAVTFGQKKDLDLRSAVLQQYTKLAPENYTAIGWIPNSDRFSWWDIPNKSYKIENASGDFEKTITLDEINTALNEAGEGKLPGFVAIRWTGPETFIFNNDSIYYSYSIADNNSVKLLEFDSNAEERHYNEKSARLAYVLENNIYLADAGNKKIAVTDHEDKNIVAGQAIHRQEFGIREGLFWSPSGNSLAFYEMDESDVTDYPRIDYTTYPASVNNFKYPMAGEKSHYAKVGVYNLSSDKIVYLKTTGEKDSYLTNLAWSPDEKLIYLAQLNRDQNHMHLNVYNAETGEFVKTLFEEKDEEYVEPEHPPLFFDELKDQFIWYSERDGYDHLYLYKTDGTLIRQLSKGNFEVEDVLGMSENGKSLLFTGTSGFIDTKLYSVTLKNGKMRELTTQPGTHTAYLSDDGKYVIDNYSSTEVPRKINLLNSEGKQLRNLLSAKDPFTEYAMPQMELFTIKAADNTTDLQCRIIKPADFDPAKKYPVLVYLYGGPHAQMITNSWLGGSSLWMHYMANQGYIVFTIDNRGTSGRGIDFEQATFRNLGDVEMADQLKAVEYLKQQPFVDGDRMAVHGWSYGGFMTVSLMLKHPDVFKVGVAGGPVTDWDYYEVMYTERYMDTPGQNSEGYEKTTLKNFADKLKGDLLLIHGLDDDVVVLQHNIMLLDAFVKNGIQVDYFNYPGHSHNVRGADRVHLMQKVLEYVMEKMPSSEN